MPNIGKPCGRHLFSQIGRIESPPYILHRLVKRLVLVGLLLDDQHAPAGPHDPIKLREGRSRLVHVVQYEAGDRQIARLIRNRQPAQAALLKLDIRRAHLIIGLFADENDGASCPGCN